MSTILKLMTDRELEWLERRLWRKMTEGSGYQPFGFDRTTMNITHPAELEALDAVRVEMESRDIDAPRRSNV